jgi:hypothetical protein
MISDGILARGARALSRLCAAGAAPWCLLGLDEARAELHFDWSLEAVGQGAYVDSKFTLAPLSTVPAPAFDTPSAIGRFYGRADFAPYFQSGENRFGVQVGLYSNLNSAYDYDRGVVPFDRTNLELTRIKPEDGLDFDRLLIFYEGAPGRVELGWSEGPNARAKATAPLDWGLGSVGGDYPYFFDKPHDVGFVSLAALGSANTSPRIAYYSPAYLGVSLGLSYQPDTRNTGLDLQYGGMALGIGGRRVLAIDAPLDAALDMPGPDSSFEGFAAGFRDVGEAGLYGEHEIGAFILRSSAGIVFGQAIKSPSGEPFNDLLSYQFGLLAEYENFSVGAGYSWVGDSGYAQRAHWRQRQNQYSFHMGAQYRCGDWTFGLAGLLGDDAGDPTERSDRQLHVYSIGARYAFDEHLDFGIELDRIQTLSADFGDFRHHAIFAQLRLHLGRGAMARPMRPMSAGAADNIIQ